MLNRSLRKEAIADLEESIEKYDKVCNAVQKYSKVLCALRKNESTGVIRQVQDYINILANSPKEFDRSFENYKSEFRRFDEVLYSIDSKVASSNIKAGGRAVAGTAIGVGTAALMPSAAMAIATTFGTASTGTAIASLSGAAATNAALAWIGGGALAAGGGGMAAGSAFLALAGPIGIGVGAIGLLGGLLYSSSKNKEIAEEANEKRAEVEKGRKILAASRKEIRRLIKTTKDHHAGTLALLDKLRNQSPDDYHLFSSSDKEMLAALINHIESLSALINKKVE